MRAAPVVSAVAILSLALGIGANTAMFSILDSLLLRSLPVKDPQRLVMVGQLPQRQNVVDEPDLGGHPRPSRALRRRPRLVEHTVQPLAGRTDGVRRRRLDERALLRRARRPGDPRTHVDGRRRPARRRAATARSRSSATRFWQRRFGGAADVDRPIAHGRARAVHDRRRHAAGILRRRRRPHVRRRDSLGTEPLIRGKESSLDRRSSWWLNVMARLKAGQSLEAGADRAARRAAADARGDDAAGLARGRQDRTT